MRLLLALILATASSEAALPSYPVTDARLLGSPQRASTGGAPLPAATNVVASEGLSLTTSTPGANVHTGRTGTVSHMGPGYPADYLALPIGPGKRVLVCGPARCLTLVSTDAGPNRAMLRAGRIADVSVALFRRLCGCPESRGLFRGSWRLAIRLPDTSTEATP